MYDGDIEPLLYSIIEEVSKNDEPIVFCGCLALKDILYSSNPNLNIERKTVDIDACWGEEYDEKRIINIFSSAVKKVNSQYHVKLFREPDIHKSMGLKILKEDGTELTKIDINIKENPFYIICRSNDVDIKYSSIEKIMADKLSAITNNHIYRRTKDLFDIYIILENKTVNIDEVKNILEHDDNKIGNANALLNHKADLEYAYNKLVGITNKPSFDAVYNRILAFLTKENIINNVRNYEEDDATDHASSSERCR